MQRQFDDLAFAENLISIPRSDLEAFIRRETLVERPRNVTELSLLLADTEGGDITGTSYKELIEFIKGLVQALIALLNQDDHTTTARILRALAIVLASLDQKLQGAAGLKAEKLEFCFVTVIISDAYIDNLDISKGWNFKFHIEGTDVPVTSSADSVKGGLGYHFDDLKGRVLTSFKKGNCGEEVDITIELTITENWALDPAKGKANSVEYKVMCPGAKWGKHAIAKLVDGSTTDHNCRVARCTTVHSSRG